MKVVVAYGVGLNGKMNKRLCEAMTEGSGRRRRGGYGEGQQWKRTARLGWGRGGRGNRWKVNGPGADPPDALGLDIWAWGLVQGVGFQRYIISFEEQHHSG